MKRVIFLIVITLALISAGAAAAPIKSFAVANDGYDIDVPLFSYIIKNTEMSYYVHVYNKTNGMPINSEINCSLRVYNVSGAHIYTNSTITASETWGYDFPISASTFNTIGEMQFLVQCSNTTKNEGGFTSQIMFVVEEPFVKLEDSISNGFISTNWVYRILAILMFLVLILFIFGFIKKAIDAGKKKRNGGFEPLGKIQE